MTHFYQYKFQEKGRDKFSKDVSRKAGIGVCVLFCLGGGRPLLLYSLDTILLLSRTEDLHAIWATLGCYVLILIYWLDNLDELCDSLIIYMYEVLTAFSISIIPLLDGDQ